ncbi:MULTISPECIES: hypothetical protein [Methylobacterium]|jgi:hypothetical protein|uniref:hypothetical protein n=1 Tax=Methylobacterium TaxID=407 RepID=UPI00037F965C|nr:MULTISPECIES: hypothetical protein [Methylobacterium]GAN49953.1 hypothetical protein ME121_3989 [Methylobacterium sp. ME121]MBN4095222.1 hypothetical protein [Methylobacterium sp. OT2]MBN6823966.1 hypothetical protein [Methylobacterium organophilum]OXE42367.1 hypothetical protein CCS92_08745 [Methylobacterium radiotolerans]UIN32403.1 hypothetical protein LXM90_14845 [Methylobacterium oryzae]
MRLPLIAFATAIALTTGAAAQSVPEPPIQSPQDAACREQARAQIFSYPNPNNLSLYDLGSQIWHLCMASYHGRGPNPGRTEQRF